MTFFTRFNRPTRYAMLATAIFFILALTVSTGYAATMLRPTSAPLVCGLYSWIAPELDATIVVLSWIVFVSSLLFAVLNLISPNINYGRGIVGGFLAVGTILFIYANGVSMLEAVANWGDGSIDIVATLASCP